MDALKRKKIAAALVLMTVIERERCKRAKRMRSSWVRNWIERRNDGRGVLSMLRTELQVEDPASFRNFTRIDETLFDELLDGISHIIKRQDTVMRQAISPRERLSATLRYLASGNSYQDLAYSTRIAPNTLSAIIPDTMRAIVQVFQDTSITCPNSPEGWQSVEAIFSNVWNFPHCIGALDGKHINFRPPRKAGSYYRNYKGRDSIVLLALVDASYKFIFIDIGRNGRMNDGAVFRDSHLAAHLYDGSLNLPRPSPISASNIALPHVIVADDAFPLHTNIMKPYPNRGLAHDERIFNYRLSRARRIVENAFGILANRFRILLTTIPLSVDKVELITQTCCVLHNFLLNRKPHYCQGQGNEDMVEGHNLPQLRGVSHQGGNNPARNAKEVRDKFKEYFNTVGQVSWQERSVEQGNF